MLPRNPRRRPMAKAMTVKTIKPMSDCARWASVAWGTKGVVVGEAGAVACAEANGVNAKEPNSTRATTVQIRRVGAFIPAGMISAVAGRGAATAAGASVAAG